VTLGAKPKVHCFAHDRGVGRLSARGDPSDSRGLLPGELNLFPLHAIMMAVGRAVVKPRSG